MKRIILSLAVLCVAACDDTTGPSNEGGRADGDMVFARLAASSELETTQTSFWAVKGQSRTLVMRYASGGPALEFEVGPDALLARPNGTPFLPGDSIRITVQADAQGRLSFDFQPSGLTFSPLQPALLRIDYSGYDPDVNGDGTVDAVDAALELNFGIWRRDSPGSLWLPVPSLRLLGQPVIEGRVTHFTGFALAS